MYLFITSLLVDIVLKRTCVEKCVSFDLTFVFIGITNLLSKQLYNSHQRFRREGRSLLDVKKKENYQSSLVKIQVTCFSSLFSSLGSVTFVTPTPSVTPTRLKWELAMR